MKRVVCLAILIFSTVGFDGAVFPVFGNFIFAKYLHSSSKKITTVTDLKLLGRVTPASVPSGGNVTYTFTITNEGSFAAPNTVLVQDLPYSELVSANPSSGFCHSGSGKPLSLPLQEVIFTNTIYCEVGNLQPEAIASISITVKTMVFGDGIHNTPLPISSDAHVSAEEIDTNVENNQVTLTFNSIPSKNKPPVVSINNLSDGAVFVTSVENRVTIPLSITATDADGTVSEVKVHDAESSGNAVGGIDGNYTFNFSTTRTGYHNISASVRDDEGRISVSEPIQILINSPHTLLITKPTKPIIAPNTSINIETQSSLSPNRLQAIEVYDLDILLGKLRAIAKRGKVYTYRLTIPNLARGYHSLTAILTDLTGATTISPRINFKATVLPTISIKAPNHLSRFSTGSSVDITVQTGDADGYVKEINFYANGKLIGTKSQSIVNGSSTFLWISPDKGRYSIIVTATDDTDETVSSNTLHIEINRPEK